MDFLDKLNNLLLINNISIADLSRGTNIPDSTIRSMYKFGAENIKLSNLRKISSFFNVSIDYLVDNTQNIQNPKEICITFSTKDFTLKQLEDINNYANFIKGGATNA